MGDLSRITNMLKSDGIRAGTTGDVSNLMAYLQDGDEGGVYLHDMGEIDDLERSNYILDKDTKLVYDARKETDLIRLDKRTSAAANNSANNISANSDAKR